MEAAAGEIGFTATVREAAPVSRRRAQTSGSQGRSSRGVAADAREDRRASAGAFAAGPGRARPVVPSVIPRLLELENHERIVEDIIPAKVVVTCYRTTSGWCPCCRKSVESRALEQPPAANIPHGQLGLNALATGVLLRVTHRLPFRQVSGVLAGLPGITVCPGAITRQVQRIADWLADDYEQLLVSVRSGVAGLRR